MTEMRFSSPASEASRADFAPDIADFVRQRQAIAVPDECTPGIADAWRILAEHWRHLSEPVGS